MTKKVISIWDILLVNKPTKPNDLGFEAITEKLHQNMEKLGIPIDPSKSLSFFGKLLGIIYLVLAVFMYYTILSLNRASEMMQYIAFSAYAWILMLGFVLLLH